MRAIERLKGSREFNEMIQLGVPLCHRFPIVHNIKEYIKQLAILYNIIALYIFNINSTNMTYNRRAMQKCVCMLLFLALCYISNITVILIAISRYPLSSLCHYCV